MDEAKEEHKKIKRGGKDDEEERKQQKDQETCRGKFLPFVISLPYGSEDATVVSESGRF